MTCFHPIKAYRGRKGKPVFQHNHGFVDQKVEVACGQCGGCRKQRAEMWAVRCVHEASLKSENCFVTLTYRKLPAGGSLNIEDWQNFAKRLRHARGSFRYFQCGEYGELNWRPHHHALLFGISFADRVLLKGEGAKALYTSPSLEQIWSHGYVTLGSVTWASAVYCASYILKKVTGKAAEKYYGHRRPPYVTMSRNPGLGADWIKKWKDDVYSDDSIVIEGRQHRPPRFYDERLSQEELLSVKARRRAAVAEAAESLSHERLQAKESIYNSRLEMKPRYGGYVE